MVRALLAALLLLALAGCRQDDERAPFLESRIPPDIAGRFFPPEGWAWGLVESGSAPAQRYGVAGPLGAPRAQVLIVVGAGETAEAWFETARDLIDRGITVWVLERAGQAGSGRSSGPRDLIHASSFDPDLAAVHAMTRLVIRPSGPEPFVLLGDADAAVVILRALETGAPADRAILSAPRLAPVGAGRLDGLLVRVGLGRLGASGRRGWRRDGPDDLARGLTHDAWRGRVQQSWAIANPDLRMSGQSPGWRNAFALAGRQAQEGARTVAAPVLMLSPSGEATGPVALCAAPPRCERRVIDGARPALQLEIDSRRKVWMDDVAAFVERPAHPPTTAPPPAG